jgi:hypothetical protein
VRLWDTLAPPASACAAEVLFKGRALPTRLCLLPSTAGGPGPGALLLVGDDAGAVSALDVRMLSDGRQVWTSSPHGAGGSGSGSGAAGVAALVAWDAAEAPGALTAEAARRGAPAMRLSDVAASAGRDGRIALLNVHTGDPVQIVEGAHFTERRGLLGGRLGGGTAASGSPRAVGEGLPARRPRPAGAAAAAVTGLAACPEGLLSCGVDGAVRFHPLSHVWA